MPDVASAGASFVGDARAEVDSAAEYGFRLAPPTVANLATSARLRRLAMLFCARRSRRTFLREPQPIPSLRESEQPRKDPPCTSFAQADYPRRTLSIIIPVVSRSPDNKTVARIPTQGYGLGFRNNKSRTNTRTSKAVSRTNSPNISAIDFRFSSIVATSSPNRAAMPRGDWACDARENAYDLRYVGSLRRLRERRVRAERAQSARTLSQMRLYDAAFQSLR